MTKRTGPPKRDAIPVAETMTGGATVETGESGVTDLLRRIEDAGASDQSEITARLETASAGMLDTTDAEPIAPRGSEGRESGEEPSKKKGGWPKGRSRKGANAATPKGPRPRSQKPESGPAPEVRSFATKADLESQLAAAQERLAALEREQLISRSAVTDEELQDLREEINGIILTIQLVGRQKYGRHAILTEEQSLSLSRMWMRPAERALRLLARRTDDGRLPGWVFPAIQLLLAGCGTIAVLWPNWTGYIDEQATIAGRNGQGTVRHVSDGGAAEAQPVSHVEMPVDDFPRPLGAQGL